MSDEPRKHPFFLLLLAATAFATIPIAFVGRAPHSWFGLPVWLWSSAFFTLLLSGLTTWGILRYWKRDDDD